MILARPTRLRHAHRSAIVAIGLILGLLASVIALPGQSTTARAEEGSRSISGVVSLPEGAPAMWLAALQVSASEISTGSYRSTPVDPATGVYTLTDVEPGSYRVHFWVNSYWDGTASVRPNLISEFYDDTTNYSDAKPVDVTAASATNIDAHLALGGSISGKVTLPEGADPSWLGAVMVNASSTAGNGYAYVDPTTGDYTVTGLTPGSYRVQFTASSYGSGSTRPNLIGEYYDDTTDYLAAKIVDVPAGSVATSIDAQLAMGRSISGKVMLPEGADPTWLGAVSVNASSTSGSGSGYANVDPATGEYTMTGLTPGSYQVQFSAGTYWDGTADVHPNLISEYYDNATDWGSATQVDVSTGDRSGIDAVLEEGRSISGTVSLPDGAPQEWLNSVSVSASSPNGLATNGARPDPATGEYTLTGLAPGSYTVAFRTMGGMPGAQTPNLVDEFYDNAYSQADAEPVDVSAGDREDIDATLETGTTISGTVTLPADAPAEWRQAISVSAMSSDGSSAGYNSTVIDHETGEYSISRLAPGDHRISFSASGYWDGSGWVHSDIVQEYYDNAASFDTAEVVSTTDGNRTAIDAELEHGASFSGTIDVSALAPAEGLGIGITITDLTGTIIYNSYGDPFPSDGLYDLNGGTVRPGSYRVAVSTMSWDEATSRSTTVSTQFLRFGSASSITLNAGDAITDLNPVARAADASLAGGILTEGFTANTPGTVVGSALAYERLDADWVRLPFARFDAMGNGDTPYNLALPGGTYTVGYETDYAETAGIFDVSEEWWNMKSTLATADALTLTAGQHSTDIDGTLHATRKPEEGPRSISGVVSLPEGAPVEWLAAVQVSASPMSGGSYRYASLDPTTGAYTFADLEAGSYRVQFAVNSYWDGASYSRPNLVSEYFDDTTDYSSATPVDVTVGSATNVNAELAMGRSISGKVTLPAGADPASLRAVSVNASGNGGWGSASVDPTTGEYTVAGLAPGSYQVQFSVNSYWDGTTSVHPNLVAEYYDNATDWGSATPVDVSTGDKSGIDAALEEGRSISGTVSLPDGAPEEWLNSVGVSASSPNGGSYSYASLDSETGDYTLTGLASGTYTVAFRVMNGMPGTETPNLVDEFYDNAYTLSDAEPVDVSAGDREDIDATLETGTTISGTVTLPADAPAEWRQAISVNAVAPDGSSSSYNHTVLDNETGDYSISGLAPGDHRIRFSADSYWDGSKSVQTDIAPEYFDNAATIQTSQIVSTASGDKTGIDAELEHGAWAWLGGSLDLSALQGAEGYGITVTDATGTTMLGGFGDPLPESGHVDLNFGRILAGTYRIALTTSSWDATTARSVPVSTQYLRFGADSSITLHEGDVVTDLQLKAQPTDTSLAGSVRAEGLTGTRSGSILGSALVYERIEGQWVRLIDGRFDATTNGDSPYTLALPAGTYTVGFEDEFSDVQDATKITEQWWDSQTNLNGADAITLTAGEHRTNINGSLTSSNVAPVITRRPAIAVTAAVGDEVTLSAAATGTPAPTVQWESSADDGATWNAITGATDDVYTFEATPGQNATLVRATYANGLGSVSTEPTTLTVTRAALTAPTDLTVTGTNVVVKDGTTYAPGPLTLKWTSTSPAGSLGGFVVLDNGQQIGDSLAASESSVVLDLPAGSHSLQVKAVAVDALVIGDHKTSAALSAVVDTTAPVVTIVPPSSPTKATSWSKVSGTIADADSGPVSVTVKLVQLRGKSYYWYDGSGWKKGSSLANANTNANAIRPSITSGNWSIPVNDLKTGTLMITYSGTDAVGNTSTPGTLSYAVK